MKASEGGEIMKKRKRTARNLTDFWQFFDSVFIWFQLQGNII